MARGKAKNADTKARNGNRVHPGFETQMFLAADTLCKHLEPSDSKHVGLGLLFLTHISNTCEAKQPTIDTHVHLRAQGSDCCEPGWAA